MISHPNRPASLWRLLVLVLAVSSPLVPVLSQKPVLFKDINKVVSKNGGSDPSSFVTMGSVTFFAATTDAEGRELLRRKPNGTARAFSLHVPWRRMLRIAPKRRA